jgi:hypothetical protein
MQKDRPWDARLVEWMQESARHKDPKPTPGPITRREVIQVAALVAVLASLGEAIGIGFWPAVAGGIVGLGTRLWQSRPAARRQGPESGPELP